jgi:cell division protein FtsL
MAIPLKHLFPLQQARLRRLELERYIQLDGGRSYVAVALLLALMGVALVAQTVRVAQTGHEIDVLQTEQTRLKREHQALLLRKADAQAMQRIEKYAIDTGMIPVQSVDTQYLVLKKDHGQLVVNERYIHECHCQ